MNGLKSGNILRIEGGAIDRVGEILRGAGIGGSALFVTDHTVDGLYGARVKNQLSDAFALHYEYVLDNYITYSMALAEKIISSDISCIIGLGGGKVLDACKYAAYVAKVKCVSLPTTMANDGIASPIAVLKKADGKPKSLYVKMPDVIILDTDLILNSPMELIKAGIGDTISNYMALKDWKFAAARGKDVMVDFAYLMSQNSLDALMRTTFASICPEFIHVLANSLVLSGIAMDFAGSSRPVSGSEHLFSHALDYFSPVRNLHGIQVALGTVAVLKILGEPYGFIIDYLKRFEVCVNPEKLGITKDVFVLCMQKATSMRSRYTCLNETVLETDKLGKIYDELTQEL